MRADDGQGLLDSEFAGFRDSLTPQVAAPGPALVRRTVRRRHRAAVVAGISVATSLVAGSTAVYAALGTDRAWPPEVGATPTPTAPSPTPSVTPPPAAPPPDGRIGRDELYRTPVDLPAWPPGGQCPAAGARIVERPRPGAAWLTVHAYGDVDRDGVQETLVVLRCTDPVGAGPEQAVALDRDRSGKIVTIGQVVATGRTVKWLRALDPATDGSVRVKVADMLAYDDTPAAWAHSQWRTYAWDGRRFRQTGGPTRFGAHPLFTDLRVSASDVVFDPASRHGSITVTVTNRGPRDARSVVLTVDFDTSRVTARGPGWKACADVWNSRVEPAEPGEPAEWHSCELALLRAGEQRTLVLGVALAPGQPTHGAGTVDVRHGGEAPLPLPDLNPKDNRDPFRFR